MVNNAQLKIKLKLLGTKGINWVIVDLIDLISEDLDFYQEEDDDLAKLTRKYINRLKTNYQKQLKVDDIISKQTDLEDLITICKLEEYAQTTKEDDKK